MARRKIGIKPIGANMEVDKMLEADLKEFRLWLRVNPRPQKPKLPRKEGQRLETLIAADILEQWNLYEIRIKTRNGLFILRR